MAKSLPAPVAMPATSEVPRSMGTAKRPMTPKMSAMVRSDDHIDRSVMRSERNSANMSKSTQMTVTMSERI